MMTYGRREALGIAMVVGAAIGYGTLGSLAEMARADGISSSAFATGRMLLAGLLLLLAIGLQRSIRPPSHHPRRLDHRALLMVLGVGVMSGLVSVSLLNAFARTSVAVGSILFFTYPVFVAIVAYVWFHERPSGIHWLAIGTAVIGCALVAANSAARLDPLGFAFALFAAFGAAAFVLAARYGYGAISPLHVSAGLLLAGGAALLAFLTMTGGLVAAMAVDSARGLLLISFAALTSAAVPTVLFIAGIQRIGASPASVLATLEPVAAVALAAAVLQQIPGPTQLMGGALVVVAAALLLSRSSSMAAVR